MRPGPVQQLRLARPLMRPRRPHRPRLVRSSRSGRPARRHAPGSRQQYGASSSPQKLLSSTRGVDDDDCGDALNVANLENKGSVVGSQEHGETISHVPGPDGVVLGVKDVGLAQAVLQRRSGNDRIVHRSKVTCDALCGRGVWSRSASRRLLRECAPGGRADAADVLAEVGVERGAHACRAGERRHTGAGLSFLWTGVTIGDFSGGGTASAGSLAEGDADVGAGQGWLWGGGVWRVEAGGL